MNTFEKLKILIFSDAFRSVAMILIISLLAWDIHARKAAVNEITGKLQKFEMSRAMLKSRAEIQVVLLNAALENRPLTATEIDTIKRNWNMAEFHEAEGFSEEKPKEQ